MEATFTEIIDALVGIDQIVDLPENIHVPQKIHIQITREEGELLKSLFLSGQQRGLLIYDPWSGRLRPLMNHSDVLRILIRSLRKLAEEDGALPRSSICDNGVATIVDQAVPRARGKRGVKPESH